MAPIQSADEMNQDPEELVQELSAVPEYVARLRKGFGTSVTISEIGKALAAFERTLMSLNSPFDRYLAGDTTALSPMAHEGWQIFRDAGCIRCHHGSALTDGKFYRIGVGYRDPGRGGATGRKQDLYAFRTPGLRDVALTAPYMHDGSFETLEQVVHFYFRSTLPQPPDGLTLGIEPLLGRSFSEIAPLVAFLESLPGESPDTSPPKTP